MVQSRGSVLNEVDFKTGVWLKIRDYAEDRLEVLRKELEGDLNEVKTAKVRGRIQEIKKLLNLASPLDSPVSNLKYVDRYS